MKTKALTNSFRAQSQVKSIIDSILRIRSSAPLSGHEHNYGDVRCAEFGLWPGARREHIPQWICDRRATPPQAKFGATPSGGSSFSARLRCSLLTDPRRVCSSLAPGLAEKSLAA